MSHPKRQHDIRSIAVRGGNLTFADWGSRQKDAPVILAIHGVTASHVAWLLFADALAIDRALVVGHSMGAFVATTFAAANPNRVSDLLLVDGGLPLALPPGISQEAATAAALGAALTRLSMTFASHHDYREFWRVHPSLVGNWSDSVEAYVDYDLIGDEGNYRPSTPLEAVAQDSRELFANAEYENALTQIPKRTRLLTAPRGLLNESPGLYPPEQIAEWKTKLPILTVTEVADVNHYMIVMGERGAEAVAQTVRFLCKNQ